MVHLQHKNTPAKRPVSETVAGYFSSSLSAHYTHRTSGQLSAVKAQGTAKTETLLAVADWSVEVLLRTPRVLCQKLRMNVEKRRALATVIVKILSTRTHTHVNTQALTQPSVSTRLLHRSLARSFAISDTRL